MNRDRKIGKNVRPDLGDLCFFATGRGNETGCYQTCSGEEWHAGRGGGARGDCGGYWGDEVKGADIVRGGRARDYS